MNKIGKFSVVAAAAAATILATGSSAYAGTDASSSVAGSWSRFISYGDKFENCDTGEDGLISYVAYEYVRIDGSLQTGSHYNPGSNGDCSQWDHNFGEGVPSGSAPAWTSLPGLRTPATGGGPESRSATAAGRCLGGGRSPAGPGQSRRSGPGRR